MMSESDDRTVTRRLRCSLIGMWVVAGLVSSLFAWAAIHAPPLFVLITGGRDNIIFADVYSFVNGLARIIHGVVFLMLVNIRALRNVYSDFTRRIQ